MSQLAKAKDFLFATSKGRFVLVLLASSLVGGYLFLLQENLRQRVERTAGGTLPENTVIEYLDKDETKFKVDYPGYDSLMRCRTEMSDKDLVRKSIHIWLKRVI